MGALNLEGDRAGRRSVSVAAVDGALRSAKPRNELPVLEHVGELVAHDRTEDPAAAMGGEDANPAQAPHRHGRASGNGESQREDCGDADQPASVEGS